ncbi:MAG: DUF1963 domain-containing protein [Moorea sp. SIO2B7]|nr:DUF1963 domain-containing protein [Moorena sp. SIO2B7]
MEDKLDLKLSRDLKKYRKQIEATIKPYLEIKPTPHDKTTWWQSKFGGFPYLPKGFDYPKTADGEEYLFLLAQINFSELPTLKSFPKKGILQFYICDDDDYGCDYDNITEQDGFRILYFPEPDLNVKNLTTNFDFLPEPEELPFYRSFSLTFKRKTAPITASDYNFEKIFEQEIANQNGTSYYRFKGKYKDELPSIGHKIGGYPYFNQEDPRYRFDEKEPYILFFQIDSDFDLDIMWGEDVGVGNFFIKESALKKLDFSDVIYNYDCCYK